MDAATLEWRAGELRFQFRAPEGDASDWVLEESAVLGSAAAWNPSEASRIEAIGPGLYLGGVPRSARGQAFLRVRRTALPPQGPAPVLNEIMADNVSAHVAPNGAYLDWIEVHNPHDEALNLLGFGLSDDPARPGRWRFPARLLAPGGFAVVYATDAGGTGAAFPDGMLVADFGIRSSGETLVLSDAFGREVDRAELPVLGVDQSLGRAPGGGESWHFHAKAQTTPGRENAAAAAGSVLIPAPRFQPDGGISEAPVDLRIEARAAGLVVRYTTDGSAPTSGSPVAPAVVRVEQPTFLRAAAFDASGRRSDETGRGYLVGVKHAMPVVSLATAPANFEFRNGYLFGMTSAVVGAQGQVLQNYPYSGSNAWKDREVEIQLEMYEPDGTPGLRQRAGMKVYGGWGSRGYPQKSLALFARKKYGTGKFEHRVFPELGVDAFESLVLRVSGNDNQSTHQTAPRPPITEFGPTRGYGSYFVNGTFTLMRDGMMQRLLEGMGLDTQAYRPCVVYVNGEYWGIFNLREKFAEAHLVAHHGIPEGSLDLIEGYGDVRAGDARVHTEMRNFVNTRSPAIETNYQAIAERYLEIDNFIDYNLAVIYFQNFDIGNIKCWRPRVPNGRFRWMVYDQDYGFGLWPAEIYEPAMARDYADYRNMFRFATAGTGTSTGWPNGGGRTLLLRRMLLNDGFRERFIRRCADLLNGPFREERVESTIHAMAAAIRPEIPAHLHRWSWAELGKRGHAAPYQKEFGSFTVATWESHLQVLLRFARERPARLRADCLAHFQLPGDVGSLEVRVEPEGAGRVRVNSLEPGSFPWTGVYFEGLSTTLRPVARPGFVFREWLTADGSRADPRLDVRVRGGTPSVLTARFEPAPAVSVPEARLWITEINYHSPDTLDAEDWIEIHNPGAGSVDLAGWVLRDADNDRGFVLAEGRIGPGEYRVLARNRAKFRWVHPRAAEPAAEFPFGLGNGGDDLRLHDPRGVLVERVPYGDAAPWPAGADGTGPTLQLSRPELDHARPEAWTPSASAGGTPGAP